ncbi:MAG: hypothetical protein IKF72_02200 [Kiritimatiellae bacterium]|nr:hypothetical protein [Kiritimatiellia bacterium]
MRRITIKAMCVLLVETMVFVEAFATAARPSVIDGCKWNCNYDEEKVAPYVLEDPLRFLDGRKVAAKTEWRERKVETASSRWRRIVV